MRTEITILASEAFLDSLRKDPDAAWKYAEQLSRFQKPGYLDRVLETESDTNDDSSPEELR